MSAPVQLLALRQRDNDQLLLEIARNIRGLSQSASSAVIEIGRGLIRAKDIPGHGEFGPWVKSECGFTLRSAQNYMRAAMFAHGKNESVSLLSLGAIYLLSSKSTPEAVVSIVFGWLEQGRVASETEVESLFAQHHQIECVVQVNDQSSVTDWCAALANQLLHCMGPELTRQLIETPWRPLRVELLQLLIANKLSRSVERPPMRDDLGDSQLAVGVDLVRDAEDSDLFRVEHDAVETQRSPTGWLADRDVHIAPDEPAAVADGLDDEKGQSAAKDAIPSGGADLILSSVQAQQSDVAKSLNFQADTEGSLHGIPNFLRRAQPVEICLITKSCGEQEDENEKQRDNFEPVNEPDPAAASATFAADGSANKQPR